MVIISGLARNSTGGAGAGTTISGRYSNSVPAPPPGASAALGTAFGSDQHIYMSNAADYVGFTVTAIISSLTTGIPCWFDLAVQSTAGSTAFLKDIQTVMIEF
jgi:hypothetical protein